MREFFFKAKTHKASFPCERGGLFVFSLPSSKKEGSFF